MIGFINRRSLADMHVKSPNPGASQLCAFTLVLFFAGLCMSGPSTAAINAWSWIGPPGGSATELQLDRADPSRIVAKAGGIITSSDGGATWTDAYFEGTRIKAGLIAPAKSRIY